MNRFFSLSVILILCSCLFHAHAAELQFTGLSDRAIEIVPDKSSGIDMLYVVPSANGARAVFESAGAVKWYRYSQLGGGYAEEITAVEYDDDSSTVALESDMGYIIEAGGQSSYFWVTDYSKHECVISSVAYSPESGCSEDILITRGSASAIHYYGINGRQFTLSRDIKLTYHTLEWNEESSNYVQIETEKELVSFDSTVTVTPPAYCSTRFTISGDRFLEEWGRMQIAESEMVNPRAVDCHTTAVQNVDEGDKSNVINGNDGSGLGGSAPCEITFSAYVTDAVIHHEWQMSRDPEFENINYRINDQDLVFTFREDGTTYVRYVGSNSDGSCETIGDTYTISIGTSELKCPNAFSPGASEGVNDEWKVSYRSLVEFECWIFDRYGTQLYHFDNPSGGWDGKYKGKLVSPGVYYYVIRAKGADGREYKKDGDINIIRFKSRKGTSQE